MHSKTSNSMRALAIITCMFTATSGFAAATTPGPVTQIDFVNGSASWMPQLLVKVNGSSTLYIGQQPTGGCGLPTTLLDTIKVWQSMLMAAMLAGKPVTIYYDTCGANNYIYSVVITP